MGVHRLDNASVHHTKADYTRKDTGELRKGYLSTCVQAHLVEGPCEVQDAPSHVPSYMVDPDAPASERNKPDHPMFRFPNGYSISDCGSKVTTPKLSLPSSKRLTF